MFYALLQCYCASFLAIRTKEQLYDTQFELFSPENSAFESIFIAFNERILRITIIMHIVYDNNDFSVFQKHDKCQNYFAPVTVVNAQSAYKLCVSFVVQTFAVYAVDNSLTTSKPNNNGGVSRRTLNT